MFYLAIDEALHVRTLHPKDAGELFIVLERNRSRLYPWIHPSALPETLADARKFTIECFFNTLGDPAAAVKMYGDYFQELGQYFPLPNPPMEMGIWSAGRLAGEIMLGRLQEEYASAEFGYWLDKDHEGRGIVTRCVSVLMNYAVEKMGIERFVIGCAVENQRSRAVPERLGFRLEEIIPQGEIVGNFVYDRAVYEMRSAVWVERNKTIQSSGGR